ncbi:MAG: hypothetical protein ACPLOC_03755 [Candidatus Bathyarchaeales archaeon]
MFEILWNGKETVDTAYSWLQSLGEKAGYDSDVYFMAVYTALTGLRPIEALNSLRIISEKGLEGYLNREMLVLEHFRFPDVFIRGNKKAFVSVVTESLASRFASWRGKEVLSIEKLQKVIERRYGLPCKLQLLRKAWATVMRGVVHGEDVNLLQGRISAEVFVRNYYRPALAEIFMKVRRKVAELEQRFL